MIPRPPTSTPFPTRRSSDLTGQISLNSFNKIAFIAQSDFGVSDVRHHASRYFMNLRSEEHTSELQSLRHLVCRLLLEKKKKERQEDVQIAHNNDAIST